MKREIYVGDNLDILRRYVAAESIDLVYLDPPFNSNRQYNELFTQRHGARAAAQTVAFGDTWEWNATADHACQVMTQTPGKLGESIAALYRLLGAVPMMAYVAMMAPRLLELRRVLKPTGSIYLHCDPTASHYLKMLMDAIFGPQNFRNEIVWRRTRAHSDAKQGAQHYGRVHDVLLFYSKSDSMTWNQQHIPHDEDYVRIHYPYTEAKTKRRYGLWDITGPGGAAKGNPHYEIFGIKKYWRYSQAKMEQKIQDGRVIQPRPGAVPREIRYLDETAGIPVGSVWTDIAPINSQAQERVGFPTQKPNALLRRVIAASSNPGDVVLDPFCGCGTAVVVAEQQTRQWVGIDITDVALEIVKFRLQREIGSVPYVVKAIEPRALPEAIALARKNRKDFETWALGLVGARPDMPHQGADRGIDARFLDTHGRPVVVSVKSGTVTASQVRDLRGVIDREGAVVGVFITLYQPTKAMIREAATAGTYGSGGGVVPRIQILTIAQLLDPRSRRLEYPNPGAVLTRPPADRQKRPDQFRLPLVTTVPGGKASNLPRQEVPTAAPPPYATRPGRAAHIARGAGRGQQLGIEQIEEAVPWQLARQQLTKAPSRRATERRGTYRRRRARPA